MPMFLNYDRSTYRQIAVRSSSYIYAITEVSNLGIQNYFKRI